MCTIPFYHWNQSHFVEIRGEAGFFADALACEVAHVHRCLSRFLSERRTKPTCRLSSTSALNTNSRDCRPYLEKRHTGSKETPDPTVGAALVAKIFSECYTPSSDFCCVLLRIHKLALCLENAVQYCIRRGGPLYIVLASTLIGSVVVVYFGFVFPQASRCFL